MFTFVSGNKAQAADTVRILKNLAQLVQQEMAQTKSITLKNLAQKPDFVLPAKGDFRMTSDDIKRRDPTNRLCVYDGNVSYVDWVQTLRHGVLVIAGLVQEQ